MAKTRPTRKGHATTRRPDTSGGRGQPGYAAEPAHHGLPVHEVVLLLETDAARGLSREEVARRRNQFGSNELPGLNAGASPANWDASSTTPWSMS
ncbi:cation-transporting P-type ATPase [Pseudarthrobacter sp. Fe7]|nr:cation-transporting P-type ATPase [Pseudarthrobacter sp. Fe7]